MDKQMSLSALGDELAQVRTNKKFLEQIDHIVLWGKWAAIIKPRCYKGERGNKPYDLDLMLLHLLQNLYNLSDEATVAEAIDSRAFSDFCGVESSNQVQTEIRWEDFRIFSHTTVCRSSCLHRW